ncbi:MAG: bifunctional sugar-1-phosphate nucleotidylyltransferase/acetyltransferase [Candidatus Woesearchaeota archaeon]
MQAVILAAGKSTRMQPLTVTRPKALLPILDRSVIQVLLDNLQETAEEAIIIVGYLKEQVMQTIGESYKNIKIRYIEQKEQLGTGHALLQAKDLLKGKFLVLNGDDLYSEIDIQNCSRHELCVLGKEIKDPQKWGIISMSKGNLLGIIEKPKETISNIANTGLYVLDNRIFAYLGKTTKSERGEIEIPAAITMMCKEHDISVETVQDYWLPIGYPWQLLEANVFFLNRISESSIKGTIEENVHIKGTVVVGENTVIKSGTYIEGPAWIGKNCEIGPQAYIRKDTILLDNVRTRAEIVDSLLMKGVTAKHDSYIGHSVLGENCNIGAGTITADYRHDGNNHVTIVMGKKVDTERRKLGAFIGDNVMTAIHTSIYPGRKIWPKKTTLPGEIVTKDIL